MHTHICNPDALRIGLSLCQDDVGAQSSTVPFGVFLRNDNYQARIGLSVRWYLR